MLQVGIGADGALRNSLLFDILTCHLSRRYCMIGCTHTHLELKAQAITVNNL